MKTFCRSLFAAAFFLLAPFITASQAFEIEGAVGMWNQSPSGLVGYKGTDLNLESDMKFGSENQLLARLNIDMPLFLPNVYLMATPMSFRGTGSKNVAFTFNNVNYGGNVPFTSEVDLNHYDIALYYGIPLTELASLGVLDIDLGLDLRVLDFSAKITQGANTQSTSFMVPVPMVYASVQFSPTDSLALETELRGIAYSGDHYIDFIGRLKYTVMDLVFVAGGYRYESFVLNTNDVKADFQFGGIFLEAGINF